MTKRLASMVRRIALVSRGRSGGSCGPDTAPPRAEAFGPGQPRIPRRRRAPGWWPARGRSRVDLSGCGSSAEDHRDRRKTACAPAPGAVGMRPGPDAGCIRDRRSDRRGRSDPCAPSRPAARPPGCLGRWRLWHRRTWEGDRRRRIDPPGGGSQGIEMPPPGVGVSGARVRWRRPVPGGGRPTARKSSAPAAVKWSHALAPGDFVRVSPERSVSAKRGQRALSPRLKYPSSHQISLGPEFRGLVPKLGRCQPLVRTVRFRRTAVQWGVNRSANYAIDSRINRPGRSVRRTGLRLRCIFRPRSARCTQFIRPPSSGAVSVAAGQGQVPR